MSNDLRDPPLRTPNKRVDQNEADQINNSSGNGMIVGIGIVIAVLILMAIVYRVNTVDPVAATPGSRQTVAGIPAASGSYGSGSSGMVSRPVNSNNAYSNSNANTNANSNSSSIANTNANTNSNTNRNNSNTNNLNNSSASTNAAPAL